MKIKLGRRCPAAASPRSDRPCLRPLKSLSWRQAQILINVRCKLPQRYSRIRHQPRRLRHPLLRRVFPIPPIRPCFLLFAFFLSFVLLVVFTVLVSCGSVCCPARVVQAIGIGGAGGGMPGGSGCGRCGLEASVGISMSALSSCLRGKRRAATHRAPGASISGIRFGALLCPIRLSGVSCTASWIEVAIRDIPLIVHR